jgi:hypothetical protein
MKVTVWMPENRETEPEPTYYRRGGSTFFRNLHWNLAAGVVYTLVAALPLFVVVFTDRELSTLVSQEPATVLIWAFATSIAYPVWAWAEVRAFESWVRQQQPKVRDVERAHFKLMAETAHNFWQAVLATYTIAGIWQIAGR